MGQSCYSNWPKPSAYIGGLKRYMCSAILPYMCLLELDSSLNLSSRHSNCQSKTHFLSEFVEKVFVPVFVASSAPNRTKSL